MNLCYGKRSDPHLWTGAFHFNIVTGVKQDDQMGRLLFALALQPVVYEIIDSIPRCNDKTGSVSSCTTCEMLFAFYIVDGILAGRHHIMRDV